MKSLLIVTLAWIGTGYFTIALRSVKWGSPPNWKTELQAVLSWPIFVRTFFTKCPPFHTDEECKYHEE